MPIYAYRCAECGHAHDALQKIADAPLTDCPACGKPALVKQVTAAGFQLKGSGWYVTDFRDNGKSGGKAAATSSAGADAPASTPAAGGGEATKPAAATESAAPAKSAAS